MHQPTARPTQRTAKHGHPPRCLRHALAGAAAWALLPASAAPLDELLTALPERMASHHYLEVAADRLNSSLNFFRKRDDALPGTEAVSGDYQGVHLAGGLRLGDKAWVSGSLWQRNIRSDADHYRYQSWQLAGQYRLTEAEGTRPALALRLSGWGNAAAATTTTTPVRVQGATLNTVTVDKPSDRQWQADLIATWLVAPTLDMSATVGAGRTQLAYQGLSATTTRNGCQYNLAFTDNDIFGTLATPCTSSTGVIRQFYDSSGDYGVDVPNEIAWGGRFWQAGVNLEWRTSPEWTLRAGLLVHSVRRQAVDDILAARGDAVYRGNRIISLEGSYRFHSHWSAFARTQINSHLFVGEIPVTYNTTTADSFVNKYSLISVGLRGGF